MDPIKFLIIIKLPILSIKKRSKPDQSSSNLTHRPILTTTTNTNNNKRISYSWFLGVQNMHILGNKGLLSFPYTNKFKNTKQPGNQKSYKGVRPISNLLPCAACSITFPRANFLYIFPLPIAQRPSVCNATFQQLQLLFHTN